MAPEVIQEIGYDCVPLGHGVSQLTRHPKVRQLGVTLHIEQNVASLENIKIMIRNMRSQ